MISVEKQVYNVLFNDEDVKKATRNIFVGVAPSNISDSYIVIINESKTPLDRNLSGPGFKTKSCLITICCYGKDYDDSLNISNIVTGVLEESFNSSVIGMEYDTDFVGSTVRHLQAITCVVTEKNYV